MFLRRVDPNLLARERAELADGAVQPVPVTVHVGDGVEPGVLYGWARADSERSGKGLILTTREFVADLHEEVLRWATAASIRPCDSGRAGAADPSPRGRLDGEFRS